MLYTRKGDDGTTKTFGCDQRISKSSIVAEALGTLDEVNSFLGLCKVKSKEETLMLPDSTLFRDAIHDIQKNLFIIQAEIAGSPMTIDEDKLKNIERIIDDIEKELPPIKAFFISGGKELATFFDIARTLARRAERRVVEAKEEGKVEVGDNTLAYLNRLSSLLYALARLTNNKYGITEQSPDYQ